VATLVLCGPPLVVLGAVTPFTTRLLTDSGLASGKAAGRALAASTLGSLVGTYLPALFLLETVGSRGTVFVAAGGLALARLLLIGLPGKGGGLGGAIPGVAALRRAGAPAAVPHPPGNPWRSGHRGERERLPVRPGCPLAWQGRRASVAQPVAR